MTSDQVSNKRLAEMLEEFRYAFTEDSGCTLGSDEAEQVFISLTELQSLRSSVTVIDEMEAAVKRIRDASMLWTIKGQPPEAGVFGVIAQDADWLCDAFAALSEPVQEMQELPERNANAMQADLDHVSAAIGSVRWMDPPDGGNVSLGEQVNRMRQDLETAEASLAAAREEKTEMAAAIIGMKSSLGFAEWGSLKDAESVLQEIIDTWHPKLAALTKEGQ